MARALSVIAVILAAVALVVNFVIPGPTGLTGPQGERGIQGEQGLQGSGGPIGPIGPSGLSCWDLNQNGVKDVATEDLNGDGVVNVLDCVVGAMVVVNATWSAGSDSTASTTFEVMPAMIVDIETHVNSTLVIIFSGEVWLSAPGYLMARAMVDSTAAEPGSNNNLYLTMQTDSGSVSVTFFMKNVAPGIHTVTIEWRVFNVGYTALTNDRSLVVMAIPT